MDSFIDIKKEFEETKTQEEINLIPLGHVKTEYFEEENSNKGDISQLSLEKDKFFEHNFCHSELKNHPNMVKRKQLTNKQEQEISERQSDHESDSSSSCDFDDIDSYINSTSSDSEEETFTNYSPNWVSSGKAQPPFDFTSNSGVKFKIENKVTPMTFFEQYFDNAIFERITNETNRYARQYLFENNNKLTKNSRFLKWVDTSLEEIKVYIALLILQGVDSKSETHMYFSKRKSVCNCLFSSVMSSRRFYLLSRFLYFVDNTSITYKSNVVEKKLSKIQPLINLLLPKFKNNYIPKKNIVVNDSILGSKGRLSFTHNLPTKKRFGLKFYELCESNTGYIWNFLIYTGSDTKYCEQYRHLPIMEKIVCSLCNPLFDKGYCLYTDSSYTSPTLADILVERQTDYVGTLDINCKGVPQQVKEKKLKKGEIITAFKKKTMILKWKDKKEVVFLSTIHDNSMVNVVSKRGVKTEKPKAIVNYNANIEGKNLKDDLLCHYTTARNRMKRFYMKIFRYLLDASVLNSFIAYKQLGGTKSRIEYIVTLAEYMVSTNINFLPFPISSAKRSLAMPSKLIGTHFSDFCSPSEIKMLVHYAYLLNVGRKIRKKI